MHPSMHQLCHENRNHASLARETHSYLAAFPGAAEGWGRNLQLFAEGMKEKATNGICTLPE